MGFIETRSYQGWDLAYSSKRSQDYIGVINPDLLPASWLMYQYDFLCYPQPQSAVEDTMLNFLGATAISVSEAEVEYDLDIVQSDLHWNDLILADSTNINGDILTLPNYVFAVSYVFKVTLDANGDIESFYNADGANPKPFSELPSHPNEGDSREAWQNYYRSFESDGQWGSYNRFLSQEGSPDQDYTYNYHPTGNQTNSKRIKVKNLVAGEHYIISYEAVAKHFFRHAVYVKFKGVQGISFGVSILASILPTTYRTEHFLWKKWKDADGKEHEGWRISEAWNLGIKAHKLKDENSSYDPVNNPIVGIDMGVAWCMFNMTERNLQIKDDARIGYSRSYATYLSDKIPVSTVTAAVAATIDTNNVTPATVHRDNFSIEYVSDNTINYSGGASNIAFQEMGASMGVLFDAPYMMFTGYIQSGLYKKNDMFPKNTRLISAFSRIRNGAVGRTIWIKTKVAGDYVSVVEDPFFFMTINRKLYYHYFNDGLTYMQLSERMNTSSDLVTYSYTTTSSLMGSSGSTLPGSTVSPGRNIIIKDNVNTSKTFIDDTTLTTHTTKYGMPTSYASYVIETGEISDVTSTYPDKPSNAKRVFRIPVSSTGSTVGALKIIITAPVTSATSTESSVLLRIKGESASLVREMTNVTVFLNHEAIIDLGAWEGMQYITIMSDANCSLNKCDKIILDPSVDEQYHLIGDISSMAATTDKRGNFLLFFTDKDGRLNVIVTGNAGHSWARYDSIFNRGDRLSNARGVPNMQENEFFVFHFYKDALLCGKVDMSIFAIPTDSDRKTEALDTIRRQACYLVWGKAIKPIAERSTQRDGSGNIIYEDLADNVISDSNDVNVYQSNSRSVMGIAGSGTADTSTKKLNESNKFIYIGKATADNGLASSAPSRTYYSVYRSRRGALRLFIEHEDSQGKFVWRNLNSCDNGLNWQDGWQYSRSAPTDKIVRINYLSKGEDTEEGTYLSFLYNINEDKAYMFYFYSGAILCKVIADEIFYMSDKNDQADILNSLPIYAVAGNLQAVVGESNYEVLAPGVKRNIIFNFFQRNPVNLSKYYNEEYYVEQPISGYMTDHGYLRIFLINSNKSVDGYIYDGGIWRPENAIIWQ